MSNVFDNLIDAPAHADAEPNVANVIELAPNEPNEIHPVMIVTIGTSAAELALLAKDAHTGKTVPHRFVAVDTLPFETFRQMLVQKGWPESRIDAVFSRDRYLELDSPFSRDFDWQSELARHWEEILHEPQLRVIASTENSPGAAGTPAIGCARVVAAATRIRDFLTRHKQQLIRIDADNAGLQPGVYLRIVTTFRGGTGTGATAPLAAIARAALDPNRVDLRVLMPCIFHGDQRADANAIAALLQMQGDHVHGYRLRLPGVREEFRAPFDSISPVSANNGTSALAPRDAWMQEAEVLTKWLRPATQATINARLVDLTDVVTHDLDGRPMNARQETALSVRVVWPETQRYLVVRWMHSVVKTLAKRFEAYCEDGKITAAEKTAAEDHMRRVINAVDLDGEALLRRITPQPDPAQSLRDAIHQVCQEVPQLEPDEMKAYVSETLRAVRQGFERYEGAWEDRARSLAEDLLRRIREELTPVYAVAPVLALTAQQCVADHLQALADQASAAAKDELERRDGLAQDLSQAQSELQLTDPWIRKREVTRDAADHTLQLMLANALSRVQQQQLEHLVVALTGQMPGGNSATQPFTLQGVVPTLRAEVVSRKGALKKRLGDRISELYKVVERLGQAIDHRSPVFQRALLYDAMTRNRLDAMVDRLPQTTDVPPVKKYLVGEADFATSVEALVQLLPNYAASRMSLTDLMRDNAQYRQQVLQLLRGLRPFTPLDSVVEQQQELAGRRDELKVVEVPGGAEGWLGQLLLREAIVATEADIVDSRCEEIRLFWLRDGLPWYALKEVRRMKANHDRYLAGAGAISPYTRANAHLLPGFEPPRTSLRVHTESLLAAALATQPGRVFQRPDKMFVLKWDKATAQAGFTVAAEEHFKEFTDMVRWTARRPGVRADLEQRLNDALNADEAAFKSALVQAWKAETDADRHTRLEDRLIALHVDPRNYTASAA